MSQQINLFNPVFMKQEKQFSLLTMAQALAVIVISTLLFYGYAAYKVGQLSIQAAETASRYNAELVRQAAIPTAGQQDTILKNELEQVEKKLAEQAELVDNFKSGVVGNDTGYSEYMRAFSRQIVQGLWLTGFKMTGDAQISLSGGAVNPELLPVYIQRLGRENVMNGKKFTNLQMQQPKADPAQTVAGARAGYVEFNLFSSPAIEDKK